VVALQEDLQEVVQAQPEVLHPRLPPEAPLEVLHQLLLPRHLLPPDTVWDSESPRWPEEVETNALLVARLSTPPKRFALALRRGTRPA